MAIGPDFESASALRLRNRALSRRVRELESGGAYAELKGRMSSLQREYEAKIKGLERELGSSRRSNSKMAKCRFEVFEQAERERDEAVGHAMRSAARMEERALRAERQRGEALDELTAERRRSREKDAELEYAESPPTEYYRDGCNLSLRLRDYRESELRSLHDMRVDPDNSLCERLARVFKRKQRQAIVFRSFEFLGYVCDSIAAVSNMRLAGKNVFAESSSIFDRPMPAKHASTMESIAG